MHLFGLEGMILVFSAGVFALLSPCAYPLLPGYVLYYLGKESTIRRALLGGGACAAGLVSIFSIFGILGSMVGELIHPISYWLLLIAGIIIIIMGLGMLLGIKFPTLFSPIKATGKKGFTGMYIYGIAYGLATFGCSAAIFFSILLYSIVIGGIFGGIIIFLIYSLGMGIPLIITTVLMVMAKDVIYKRIFKAIPIIEKAGGVLLIVIGAYMIYYYYFFYR